MRIGTLRRRVDLQASQETEDSYGQPVPAWATVASFWAEVRFLRGAEALNVKQTWATATHMVTARYQGAGVTPSPAMRLIYRGRTLSILSVANLDERDRTYQFTCEELL